MARFLIATAVATGHTAPTLEISRTLVERGNQVVWINGRRFRDKVEFTGATFYPWPEPADPGELEIYDAFPELRKLHGLAQLKWYIRHTFIDTSPLQMVAIDAVLEHFDADVLVADPAMLAVYYRSELSGIPSAMVSLVPLAMPSRDTAPYGLGLLPGRGLRAQVRNRLLNWLSDNVILRDLSYHENKVRGQLGVPPRHAPLLRSVFAFPDLVIQLTTPAFEYPRSDQSPNLHFVGPVVPAPDPAFSQPAWWQDLDDNRPVILVNQGTVADGPEDLVAPAIQAFRHENVLVIAVPFSAQTLGLVPENVRAETFIPFANLLPLVDVMVTNGGYGGTQLALAFGVPLVVAGATEDKMEVGARVQWSGAGINLRKQHPSPSSLRRAVREVLTNPRYRESAQRIQRDFASHDAPKRAAELLEALAQRSGEYALAGGRRRVSRRQH